MVWDGVGEGDGEGEVDGSTWHVVSVVVAAVVVTGPREAARATLDQAVSSPRMRKPPASMLSVAVRACPKRIEIALSALLVAVTLLSPVVRSQLDYGLVRSSHIRESSHLCVSVSPFVLRPGLRWRPGRRDGDGRPALLVGRLPPPIGSWPRPDAFGSFGRHGRRRGPGRGTPGPGRPARRAVRQAVGRSVGYGLLFTCMAAGGILGSVIGDRLIRRVTATGRSGSACWSRPPRTSSSPPRATRTSSGSRCSPSACIARCGPSSEVRCASD